MTDDEVMVSQLKVNWHDADLDSADEAMLAYVEKLTLRPSTMIKEDVIKLRDAGFSDGAILDINQVTSYYAFVNRLADGLGVELEPYWDEQAL